MTTTRGNPRRRQERRRSILWVLGMHRSGTSFLTECAAGFGFALPRDRQAGFPDNPRGHFEPRAVVALNDSILATLGTSWDRLGPIDTGARRAAVSPDIGARMRLALDESFGPATRCIVKDPRLSLLLPLWRTELAGDIADERCLIALRRPGDVAASLARRDGTPPDVAHLMWLSHTLAALDATASLRRSLVLFPEWALDPAGALSRMADALDLPLSDGLAEHVGRVFQGPPAVTAPADVLAGEAGRLSQGLFDALREDALHGPANLCTVAPTFRAEVQRLFSVTFAAEERGETRLRSLAARLEQAEGRLKSTKADAAAMERQLRAAEAQRAAAQAAAEARQIDAAALQALVAATEAQRDAAMQEATARRSDATALQDQVAATEAQRNAAWAEAETRRAEASFLAARLEGAEARQGGLEAEARRLRMLASRIAEARDRAISDRDALAERLATTAADLSAARGEASDARAATARIGEQAAAALARAAQLDRELAAADDRLRAVEMLYREERTTVLRPIYRNLYAGMGRALRQVLPSRHVERLKRFVPHPDGVSPSRPPPAPPVVAHPARPPASADPWGPADIFIFAIIDWDFRTQRPQHLAREMARRGHRVFYVEMESDLGEPRSREIAPGLHVVRLGSTGTGFVAPYTGVPTGRQAEAWIDRFEEFCAGIGATPTRHVVVQHPFWWPFVRHLPSENQITFDCMDDISGFSNSEPHVLEAEEEMVARADRMIVSSQYLLDRFAPRRPVALVRNAADIAHFHAAAPRPDFLAGRVAKGRLQVGYVGAIAEWFDVPLLAAVAQRCPDMQFHLCGAVTSREALALGELPNVRLYGEIAYADVPGFVQAMDVMTIPFRLLPIIRACDPVKFYEHSAAGRPTVATHMPELDRAGPLVFRAAGPDAFAAALRTAAAAGRDPDHVRALVDYALANTWALRADAFLAHMLAAPAVSAVVLSHGQPDLTLATLHSLLGAGPAYPNLDVIVVDNGSAPEDLGRLRDGMARHPAARLIENGQNLGFAAGNNVGIAAARGEYILLLNNDTFVPAGAIAAMVRHLDRSPEIGVVGPMTNNIGNEARLDVHYADMDGMRAVARAAVRGYRGMWSDVAVCAYFCAMFRAADLARFGPLEEEYGLGMFEDDDHCARIRSLGQVCALAEDAFVHHHLSASFDALGQARKTALFERNRAIFEARWGSWRPHSYRAARPASRLGGRAA